MAGGLAVWLFAAKHESIKATERWNRIGMHTWYRGAANPGWIAFGCLPERIRRGFLRSEPERAARSRDIHRQYRNRTVPVSRDPEGCPAPLRRTPAGVFLRNASRTGGRVGTGNLLHRSGAP